MTSHSDDPFAAGGDHPIGDVEWMAAAPFEPLATDDVKGVRAALSGENWRENADALKINLHLAAAIMGKTKAELVAIARKPNQDVLFELIDHLTKSAELFESYAAFVRAAAVRQLAALSVLAKEERP